MRPIRLSLSVHKESFVPQDELFTSDIVHKPLINANEYEYEHKTNDKEHQSAKVKIKYRWYYGKMN